MCFYIKKTITYVNENMYLKKELSKFNFYKKNKINIKLFI